MSDASHVVRVFVDARPVDVAPGASALDAVRQFNPILASDVEASRRLITDSRGLPIAQETPMVAGTILRVIARRVRDDLDEVDDPA